MLSPIACLHSIPIPIHTRHNKTPYELVHDKKLDLTFLRVFGIMCYPINDSEDLGKLQAKVDIGIFVGYAPNRKGYRVNNKRTRRIMETIHVTFDELNQTMAPVRISSGPEPTMMTPGQLNSGLAPTHICQRLQLESISARDTDGPISKDTPITQHALHPSFNPVTGEPGSAQSSCDCLIEIYGPKITAHIDNIVGNPSRPVSTRKQLASDALWCCFHTELSKVEPKNFKMAVTEDSWFEAMQNEIHEFDRLEVWVLVPKPKGVMIIALSLMDLQVKLMSVVMSDESMLG
ncbi:integrase, catalytic region, zinc finger, CCHC-type containing protein [Tanacetum coccineum]